VRALHSFNGADGKEPHGSLLDVKGTFYGTTPSGGKYGDGTVFSITTGGKENVLYSFGASANDGEAPYAGLTDVNGTLYGTTSGGGGTSCGGTVGCGTVFSVTTSGTEKVLHRFNGTDGASPLAGLIDVSGTLYGTTLEGGSNGGGTVFALKP
jgi:uncharacterized repeat protein (TIGR03803 family)